MILVLLDRRFAVDSDFDARNFKKLSVLRYLDVYNVLIYGVSVPSLLIESTDSMIICQISLLCKYFLFPLATGGWKW